MKYSKKKKILLKKNKKEKSNWMEKIKVMKMKKTKMIIKMKILRK